MRVPTTTENTTAFSPMLANLPHTELKAIILGATLTEAEKEVRVPSNSVLQVIILESVLSGS